MSSWFNESGCFRGRRRHGRGGVCADELESCAGSAGRVPNSTTSAGETLSYVLAACVCVPAATAYWTRRSRRSHARLFRTAVEAPRFQCCAERKRTITLLSSHIAEKFPRQREASRDCTQAEQRTTADAPG